MTNSERIRSLSDEELAKLLVHYNEDYGRYERPNGEYIDDEEENAYGIAVRRTVEWLKHESD